MADLVEYHLEGHLATITLNRPDKLNAFDANLVRDLAGKLRRFDEDESARVAILSGAGKAFSSGADVKVVQESLRHANARITMELYAQALTPDKRKAQSKVIRMILPKANQLE